jgi:RNA polymerase sigma-70 factor (ECF subfamily)
MLRPPPPVADAQARVEIADALAGLPTALREALLVVEVLGFTYDEASAVIGVPAGTVKSRVFRARTALAGRLAEGRADEM